MARTIPVRLNDSLLRRLDAAAERLGTKRAGLIRFLTDTWLNYIDQTGITTLPPEWIAAMKTLDGRSSSNQSRIKPINSASMPASFLNQENASGATAASSGGGPLPAPEHPVDPSANYSGKKKKPKK